LKNIRLTGRFTLGFAEALSKMESLELRGCVLPRSLFGSKDLSSNNLRLLAFYNTHNPKTTENNLINLLPKCPNLTSFEFIVYRAKLDQMVRIASNIKECPHLTQLIIAGRHNSGDMRGISRTSFLSNITTHPALLYVEADVLLVHSLQARMRMVLENPSSLAQMYEGPKDDLGFSEPSDVDDDDKEDEQFFNSKSDEFSDKCMAMVDKLDVDRSKKKGLTSEARDVLRLGRNLMICHQRLPLPVEIKRKILFSLTKEDWHPAEIKAVVQGLLDRRTLPYLRQDLPFNLPNLVVACRVAMTYL
jgi:hypothetical protein